MKMHANLEGFLDDWLRQAITYEFGDWLRAMLRAITYDGDEESLDRLKELIHEAVKRTSAMIDANVNEASMWPPSKRQFYYERALGLADATHVLAMHAAIEAKHFEVAEDIRRQHPEQPLFICSICGIAVLHVFLYWKSYRGRELFTCNTCGHLRI